MCGILGIVEPMQALIDIVEARRALKLIRHRGPDDEGYLLANTMTGTVQPCGGHDTDPRLELPDLQGYEGKPFNLVFGHRRLSIIDLSPLGHQPMSSSDGRYWIVYNGEIYNYLELKELLSRKGYLFRSMSDTEVILAAYREWGHDMLTRFIGMFALAILDMRERSLFIARDFFGIKPFYYSLLNSRFIFASEIKSLLEMKGVGRKGNPGRLYEYLGFGLTDFGEETLFSDILQLPAAHYAYVKLDKTFAVEPVRYWRIDLSYRQDISFDEAVEGLRRLFDESVRLHMRSDVPVGSCLSGGLDSSAIVMHMSRMLPLNHQLHAFSFIVDDPVIGEGKFVDIMEKAAGVVLHKTSPSPEEMIADMETLICSQEEPFMSTSIYAQYRLFKLAHEAGVKVLLDGQGADEFFAGYYNLIGARVTSMLSQGRLVSAWQVMKGAPRNMSAYQIRMLLLSSIRTLPPGLIDNLMRLTGTDSLPTWVSRQWFMDRGGRPHYRRYGRGREAVREELLASIECTSLPQLLRYEDRNSMCFSIESRVPFCNPEIARFALSLPEQYLVSDDGTTKAVLREAMRDIVPEAIITREKVGFATPQNEWLKLQIESVRSTMQEANIGLLPFIKKETLRSIFEGTGSSKRSWSQDVWRYLNLLCWSRQLNIVWE